MVASVIRKKCTPYDFGLRKRTYPKNPHDLYLFQSKILHLPVIFAAIIHKVEQRFKLRHVRSTRNRFFDDPFVFKIQATSQLGHPKTLNKKKKKKTLYLYLVDIEKETCS